MKTQLSFVWPTHVLGLMPLPLDRFPATVYGNLVTCGETTREAGWRHKERMGDASLLSAVLCETGNIGYARLPWLCIDCWLALLCAQTGVFHFGDRAVWCVWCVWCVGT